MSPQLPGRPLGLIPPSFRKGLGVGFPGEDLGEAPPASRLYTAPSVPTLPPQKMYNFQELQHEIKLQDRFH